MVLCSCLSQGLKSTRTSPHVRSRGLSYHHQAYQRNPSFIQSITPPLHHVVGGGHCGQQYYFTVSWNSQPSQQHISG